ncbi:cation-translocating P-type ATPase [Pleurocapsa sp. PCC 7319]|uniref:heavy metal translocating P-type ATPase n=1 Tax=Pleurocapsa sp. PCC 7319 TaxID=118161 RepID=UPI0003466592|nr:heavy metal translocating P-type ATPase [Pleurocapsa sp. PCC 7319]
MVKSSPSPLNQERANFNSSTRSELKTIALDVEGMKCAGCVKAVERQLEQNAGVISACVNLITEVAVVEYEAASIAPETLAEKLTKTGFPTQLRQSDRSIFQAGIESQEKQKQQEQQRVRQLVTAAILLFFSSIGHLHHLGLPYIPILSNIWVHFGLATLALLIPGRSLLLDGWRSLVQGMPNMNTLVGLGTVSAYLASCFALFLPQLGWECFFDEPVMLLGFILLGRTLEGKARNRASAALTQLVSLQPPIARLISKQDSTETIEIPVEQVKPGEWLRVLPGEKIPVDGTVVVGETTVDESMLTGESVAVAKTSADIVRAGTINQSGVITIEVTGIGQDTILAKIISLVEDAQTRKAPVQKLADTIAGYFAYGVMAIATLTFCFWYFYGTKIWPSVLMTASHSMSMPMGQMEVETSPLLLSLKLAIAVLVIACPCALGLATPTAILVGTSIGAETGILIKGGDILEQVYQLDTVVFDKTGTLTSGMPQVTNCIPLGDITQKELLQIAASVESNSNHPLAQGIITAAQQQNLSLLEASDFQSVLGQGISAIVAGQRIYLGNQEWLTNQAVEISADQELKVQYLAQSGKTVVYLAISGILQGLIAIEDSLRPDATQTIEQLQKLGLNTVLLTGDRSEVAQAIADKLNLAQTFSEVKPEDKAQIIRSLQQQGQTVAMIGDGINDAPALAQADVGISLQDSTDVAIASADIVLMQNQLEDVIKSIQLSRATVSKIKQNLIWALTYNVFAIPIAAGILLPQYGLLLSPVLAAVAMASSSLIVVTNSLLLNFNLPKLKY